MKQRYSSLDVIAHELSAALLTLRVSNIYDLSSKIFLIKFSKPEHKQQIVIDSGFRCHLTQFARATAAEPTVFVQRLRKVLKTRRVTSVQQVGTDRIIEFQFSDGQYRLFLEFYASGNIILTDKDLKILALLRIVEESEGQEAQRVGVNYSLEDRQNYHGIPPLTKERLRNALQKAVDKGDDGLVAGKKSKKQKADALRKALAVSISEFPPMLVDHAMQVVGFDSTLKPADVLQNEDLLDHSLRSLQEAQRVVQEITSSDVAKGYIIAKKKDGYDEAAKDQSSRQFVLYEDFHPFRPHQFEDDPTTVFLEFTGFNNTVDEFFSSIEGQRLESKLQERELTAQKKIQAARQDQENKLGGLQEVQTLNERKAGAIEANVERVQEAMDAVNGLIAQGMDWVKIGKLIELEQKRNNPVASIIRLPLKLQENTVTLMLDEATFDDDVDSAYESAYETDDEVSDMEDEDVKQEPKAKSVDKRLVIDINLALSPWVNAREYYDQRRTAVDKEVKTLESSKKALKSQEAKITRDLKKGLKQEKEILRPIRRQNWFEKFTWFVSSDGYLVLAGKDTQQNETLYKKYLKKGDVYVHADLDGAGTVIIRNNSKTSDAPIPPSTLSQAGTLAVACSTAWDSKAGMSAWWVNADQVSKSAAGGGFLPVGSFSVTGKKNFLPPAVLLLGFGVLFLVSEESKGQHTKHRIQDVDEGSSESPVVVDDSTAREVPAEMQEPQDDEESDEGDDHDSDAEEESPIANPLQQNPGDEDNSDDDDSEPTTPVTEMKELNISDATKPQKPAEEAKSESDSDSDEEIPVHSGVQTPSAQQSQKKKGPEPLKRGQKAKAKKIANKYKNQDEEDRLAAQAFLGSSAGQEKAEAEAKAKAAKVAEEKFQKERRKAQHQRTQKETAAYEEKRKMMLEQDDGEDGDGFTEQDMGILERLVGTPMVGDEILEAIPVCAPWAAMGKYKYKAKLQPGAQKKGKAVKEIVARWGIDSLAKGKVDENAEDRERMWPREVELLKGWKVEEVIGVVPVGKVRVMMAGGTAGTAGAKGAPGKGRGGKGGKRR